MARTAGPPPIRGIYPGRPSTVNEAVPRYPALRQKAAGGACRAGADRMLTFQLVGAGLVALFFLALIGSGGGEVQD